MQSVRLSMSSPCGLHNRGLQKSRGERTQPRGDLVLMDDYLASRAVSCLRGSQWSTSRWSQAHSAARVYPLTGLGWLCWKQSWWTLGNHSIYSLGWRQDLQHSLGCNVVGFWWPNFEQISSFTQLLKTIDEDYLMYVLNLPKVERERDLQSKRVNQSGGSFKSANKGAALNRPIRGQL